MILTCLENTAISSLNDSEEHTSPPATPGSLGVHVANSHFSKISAKSGNSGCLKNKKKQIDITNFNPHSATKVVRLNINYPPVNHLVILKKKPALVILVVVTN